MSSIHYCANPWIFLVNIQKYEEALEAFNKALEINPEYAEVWINRGTVYLEIAAQKFKKNDYGSAVDSLNSAMDSFLEAWNTDEESIKERIFDFFKELTNSKQIEAISTSLKTITERKEELAPLLKPISDALEIVKTKELKKYYDLQVEQRDIVVDIVRELTESEEFLPEEYRKSRNGS